MLVHVRVAWLTTPVLLPIRLHMRVLRTTNLSPAQLLAQRKMSLVTAVSLANARVDSTLTPTLTHAKTAHSALNALKSLPYPSTVSQAGTLTRPIRRCARNAWQDGSAQQSMRP